MQVGEVCRSISVHTHLLVWCHLSWDSSEYRAYLLGLPYSFRSIISLFASSKLNFDCFSVRTPGEPLQSFSLSITSMKLQNTLVNNANDSKIFILSSTNSYSCESGIWEISPALTCNVSVFLSHWTKWEATNTNPATEIVYGPISGWD